MKKLVMEEYRLACDEHPAFARSLDHAVVLLAEEVGEVASALDNLDFDNMRKELAQVIVVCVRTLKRMKAEGL